jgi:hypothetical protein
MLWAGRKLRRIEREVGRKRKKRRKRRRGRRGRDCVGTAALGRPCRATLGSVFFAVAGSRAARFSRPTPRKRVPHVSRPLRNVGFYGAIPLGFVLARPEKPRKGCRHMSDLRSSRQPDDSNRQWGGGYPINEKVMSDLSRSRKEIFSKEWRAPPHSTRSYF